MRIATLKQALRDGPRADRACNELIQLLFENGKHPWKGSEDAVARGFDPDVPLSLRRITGAA
jgi:hypothetical protein